MNRILIILWMVVTDVAIVHGYTMGSNGLYCDYSIEPRLGRSPLTTHIVFNRTSLEYSNCDIDSIRFTAGEQGYQYADSILNTVKIECEHIYAANGTYTAALEFKCNNRYSVWYPDSYTDIIVSDALEEYGIMCWKFGTDDSVSVNLLTDNDGIQFIDNFSGDTAALYLDPEASTVVWNFEYNIMFSVHHDGIADSAITWNAYKTDYGPVSTDGKYKSEQYRVEVPAGNALHRTSSGMDIPLDIRDCITLTVNYRDTVLKKTWYVIQRHYNSVDSPGVERSLLDGRDCMAFNSATKTLQVNESELLDAFSRLTIYGASGDRCMTIDGLSDDNVGLSLEAGCYIAVLERNRLRYALKFVYLE